jgi:hypothetical protein
MNPSYDNKLELTAKFLLKFQNNGQYIVPDELVLPPSGCQRVVMTRLRNDSDKVPRWTCYKDEAANLLAKLGINEE